MSFIYFINTLTRFWYFLPFVKSRKDELHCTVNELPQLWLLYQFLLGNANLLLYVYFVILNSVKLELKIKDQQKLSQEGMAISTKGVNSELP